MNFIKNKEIIDFIYNYLQSLLPLLPPALLVLSVGIGVTSSILPIFIPKRAKALKAA